MSRESCNSLNRAQRTGVYVPEESSDRFSFASAQNVPSAPRLHFRQYECSNGSNIKLLEEFEDPQFSDLPPDSSFDEVMCIMVTPPHKTQPDSHTSVKKLDERISLFKIDREKSPAQIGDVCKRITSVATESAVEPSYCLNKTPPLPKDPDAIPSPPKNPKDVVALIRRAKAIERLRKLEEKRAAFEQRKTIIKKSVRSLEARKKFTRKIPTSPKLKVVTAVPLKQTPTLSKPNPVSVSGKQVLKIQTNKPTSAVGFLKKPLPRTQHSPNYVTEDEVATILRSRKLTGLKSSNAKLLSKPKAELASFATNSKSFMRQTTPPPNMLTFKNILQRISAIRSKSDEARHVLAEKKKDILASTPQEEFEELDEFEILEELYGALKPDLCRSTQQNSSDLQSPTRMKPMTEADLGEFVALEQQHGKISSSGCPVPEHFTIDLQNRINDLKETLFQSPTRDQRPEHELPSILRYEDLQKDKDVIPVAAGENVQNVSQTKAAIQSFSPAAITEYTSPIAVSNTYLKKIHYAILKNKDMPKVYTNGTPGSAFPIQTLADAERNVALDEITMPDLDEDISLEEFGIADITPPDLCKSSISDCDLALESDFITEITTQEQIDDCITKKDATKEESEQPGLFTSAVAETEVELDTSLPNIFQIIPSTETEMPKSSRALTASENTVAQKTATSRGPIVIPPHPKDPNDYKAIIRRARAIQKKKIEESTTAEGSVLPQKQKTPTQKIKRGQKASKVYPPGEYSPSYVKAVARARSLVGLNNLSAVLNSQRTAKERADREEALEELPFMERIKKKMRSMRTDIGGLPRPSTEILATLEAIRTNLPKSEVNTRKSKWQPAGRLNVDRRMKPSERRFTHDFGRVLVPKEKIQKSKNWKTLSIMSPILEEPELKVDLIQFSPLKPHEAWLRLCNLKEQAAKHTALREVEEKAEIETASRLTVNHKTLPISSIQFSPIRLQSPCTLRTEKNWQEKLITKLVPLEGPDLFTEVAEISAIENGELHTSTKQVTAKADEYGNVTYRIQEKSLLSGEEDLSRIEPPDSLDTSDMTPAKDLSIPTTNEIIYRIQSKIKQNLNYALPDVHQPLFPASPEIIAFPKDLPDEDLLDIEIPEFEKTPRKVSPYLNKNISPFERDIRMYAWGENPPAAQSTRLSPSSPPEQQKDAILISKIESTEEIICVPPHPKDYKAMVKRAQAMQKLKKQQQMCADEIPLPKKHITRKSQVPISRFIELPPKDPKKTHRKRLVFKNRVPKLSSKDAEYPTELPALPAKYKEAVARARLLRGIKNKMSAPNPALTTEMAKENADEEAAKVIYVDLPEVERIKLKIEKLRKHALKKRHVELTAELLGTLAAIRATNPPKATLSPSDEHPIRESQTPISTYSLLSAPQAPLRVRPRKTDEFKVRQKNICAMHVMPEDYSSARKNFVDNYLKAIQPYMSPEQVQSTSLQTIPFQHSLPLADPSNIVNISREYEISEPSLEEFEAIEAESKKLYNFDTPKRSNRHIQRLLLREFSPSHTSLEIETHTLVQPSKINLTYPYPDHAPTKLRNAEYLEDKKMPDETILRSVTRPKVTPGADAFSDTIYYDAVQEFKIPVEDVLETSQLMLETPIRNIQERFQRLKDAQEKQIVPSEYADLTPALATVVYTPIKLLSPDGTVCTVLGRLSSHFPAEETEWIFNIDETPERIIRPVKQFRDLEDMPFDELEYEIEPNFTDISFEKPLSPPPRPSDVISKIESKVKAVPQRSALSSPPMLKFPEELPDEDLLELSAPSFTQTSAGSPLSKYKSPSGSIPMVWEELRPATLITSENVAAHIPTPITKPIPLRPLKAFDEKVRAPESLIAIPPHPKDPKDYVAMIRRSRAIYKLNKHNNAEEKVAVPQPTKTQRNVHLPISKWQGPPPRTLSANTKRKHALKRRVDKSKKVGDKNLPMFEEQEYPTEPPQLSQSYRDAVAKTRLLHGLKNTTAALNSDIAAKIAAKQACNALSKIDKIKARMEKIRKNPQCRRCIKPTIEQIAYLAALKEVGELQTFLPESFTNISTPLSLPKAPASLRTVSVTPRVGFRKFSESFAPAECEESKQLGNESLAEFEALETLESAPVQQSEDPITPLNIKQLISNLRQQQLATPPLMGPEERLKQLMATRKIPCTPIVSPEVTPEIHYSPIELPSSPDKDEPKKHVQQTTAQITRNNRLAELDHAENLADIQEPSYLEITPS